MSRPNPNKKGKSPYKRKQKLEYTYTFRKCSHNHTHDERHDGVTYEICDACNTIRRNSLTETLKTRRTDSEEVLKAA